MNQPNSFEEQVRRNFPKVEARPEFDGDRLWLTFYLCGEPEDLRSISKALGARGWVNVDGGEGGFLYPKVEVERSTKAILEAARATESLCGPLGVDIELIDADTSPDQQSHFETVYRSGT